MSYYHDILGILKVERVALAPLSIGLFAATTNNKNKTFFIYPTKLRILFVLGEKHTPIYGGCTQSDMRKIVIALGDR